MPTPSSPAPDRPPHRATAAPTLPPVGWTTLHRSTAEVVPGAVGGWKERHPPYNRGPGLKSGLPSPRRCAPVGWTTLHRSTAEVVPGAVGGWEERHPPYSRVPGVKAGLPAPRRCAPVGWIALHRSTAAATPSAIGGWKERHPPYSRVPGLKSGLPMPAGRFAGDRSRCGSGFNRERQCRFLASACVPLSSGSSLSNVAKSATNEAKTATT
jgi:hypothetical protein